jgi:hypothetical protein
MVGRADGFPQAPAMPAATPRPVNPPVGHNGQQAAQDTEGSPGVSPGNWGSPPGLTRASAVAIGTLSPKQEAAYKAEAEAQKAFLEFQTAKAALAYIDPKDTAAVATAEKLVTELQDRAVELAQFNVNCQKSLFREQINGAFAKISGNRFEDSSGLARAEILVQRAGETKIGLAYTARESLLVARAQLAYAQQWLAKEPENASARAEVIRCQQACLKAAVQNTVAWGVAIGKEYAIGPDFEAHRGRNPAVYDTPQIRECKAGEADAHQLEAAMRAEIGG